MERREFLKLSSLSAAAALLGPRALQSLSGQAVGGLRPEVSAGLSGTVTMWTGTPGTSVQTWDNNWAIPNFVNGRSTGFRLSDIQPGSLFAEIGLHNGDILTRLNGQSVGDPARAMQLFSELRNESSITVDVIRGGRPIRIHYAIR